MSFYFCGNYLYDSRPIAFVSSIREFKYCAFKTFLSDSSLARIISGFINVFPLACYF